jgi:hypothetical protein
LRAADVLLTQSNAQAARLAARIVRGPTNGEVLAAATVASIHEGLS